MKPSKCAVLATVMLLLTLPAAATDWEHALGIYGFGASINGDAAVGTHELNVDVELNQIFDTLEMGGMARYRAANDKLVVVTDAVFVGLGAGGADFDELIIDASIGYRFTDIVEGFVGLRYTEIDLDLHFVGPSQDHSLSAGETFYDPIIGVRVLIPMADRWGFQAQADIGGFGAGMDLTWQAMAHVGFEATDTVSFWLGYRALAQDFDDKGSRDEFNFDAVFHGPQLGVVFRF